ncbi:MAG: hypothetical protein RL095_2312 [Verrucomicrobiota bacterium]|jgi:hypothetical protein
MIWAPPRRRPAQRPGLGEALALELRAAFRAAGHPDDFAAEDILVAVEHATAAGLLPARDETAQRALLLGILEDNGLGDVAGRLSQPLSPSPGPLAEALARNSRPADADAAGQLLRQWLKLLNLNEDNAPADLLPPLARLAAERARALPHPVPGRSVLADLSLAQALGLHDCRGEWNPEVIRISAAGLIFRSVRIEVRLSRLAEQQGGAWMPLLLFPALEREAVAAARALSARLAQCPENLRPGYLSLGLETGEESRAVFGRDAAALRSECLALLHSCFSDEIPEEWELRRLPSD